MKRKLFYGITATVVLIAAMLFVGCPESGDPNNKPDFSISVDGDTEYGFIEVNFLVSKEGVTVTVTAVPETGFFTKVITIFGEDGNKMDVNITESEDVDVFTFLMPAGNIKISAEFAPVSEKPHRITIESGITGGSITSSHQAAPQTTQVTITATPDTGYGLGGNGRPVVTRISGGTVNISGTGPAFTFLMPPEAVTISAAFVPIYAVTVAPGITGGTVTVNRPNAPQGVSVTVTVTPEAGHELVGLPVVTRAGGGSVNVTGSGPFTFQMPDVAVTVTATFSQASTHIIENLEDIPAPRWGWYYDYTEEGYWGAGVVNNGGLAWVAPASQQNVGGGTSAVPDFENEIVIMSRSQTNLRLGRNLPAPINIANSNVVIIALRRSNAGLGMQLVLYNGGTASFGYDRTAAQGEHENNGTGFAVAIPDQTANSWDKLEIPLSAFTSQAGFNPATITGWGLHVSTHVNNANFYFEKIISEKK